MKKIGALCGKHPELGGERYSGGVCTACAKEASLLWRRANREKSIEYRRAHTIANRDRVNAAALSAYRANPTAWRVRQLKTRGFTLASFEATKAAQGEACAICRVAFSTLPSKHVHADHDHATGLARGVLCNGCNAALGFMADSPVRLINAAAYLIQSNIKSRSNE